MKILLCTQNSAKEDEYRQHLALYGIKSSMEVGDLGGISRWLRDPARPLNAFALREESDLFDRQGLRLARPYRVVQNQDRWVQNISTATVYHLKAGVVEQTVYSKSIPGRLQIKKSSADVFDWDDVFVPDEASSSYHEAKAGPGKMSARSLVLDAIVKDFLPFQSNRALKYGRFNEDGMIDLNHWPLKPSSVIQFEQLPWDVFHQAPFQLPSLERFGIRSLLETALSEGAHFRAARSRREWIYWAPGINAGIPLTPKEDPWAELVYLTHDMAHYVLPDLLIDVASSPQSDLALVLHRMMGETMAMVIADMFFMDALIKDGKAADAAKHGIHRVYASMHLAPTSDAFCQVLRAAARGLLLGDARELYALAGPNAGVDVFLAKYTKFALADYEWTWQNLQQFHQHPDRMTRWLAKIPTQALGLTRASEFLKRLPSLDGLSPSDMVDVVLEDVLKTQVLPKMQAVSSTRSQVLTRSIKRYLAGQLAFYARYTDRPLKGEATLVAALHAPVLDNADVQRLRQVIEEDLLILQKSHAITPLEQEIYAAVYPIVDARYVSYKTPKLSTYDAVFAEILK